MVKTILNGAGSLLARLTYYKFVHDILYQKENRWNDNIYLLTWVILFMLCSCLWSNRHYSLCFALNFSTWYDTTLSLLASWSSFLFPSIKYICPNIFPLLLSIADTKHLFSHVIVNTPVVSSSWFSPFFSSTRIILT